MKLCSQENETQKRLTARLELEQKVQNITTAKKTTLKLATEEAFKPH